MSAHSAIIIWERGEQSFTDKQYSRGHRWRFDGGVVVPASSSPQTVPLPLSETAAVDPEEAFIASLSSCHMLWFLSIAAAHGFCVDRYEDRAEGVLGKDSQGRYAMTRVTLKPKVDFSGVKIPSIDEIHQMHHDAHEKCFIANSVKTEVRCEPV